MLRIFSLFTELKKIIVRNPMLESKIIHSCRFHFMIRIFKIKISHKIV